MDLGEKDKQVLEGDYEEFLQEIEGDKEMLTNINMYKQSKSKALKSKSKDVDTNNVDDMELDDEGVRLDELLEDLTLNVDEVAVLNSDEAAAVAPIELATSGFDPADINIKEFKFS